MTISIIGSNGSKMLLITENKINNKFNDIELEYNLLKDKYLNKCNSNIVDKKCYKHFLHQLSNLFTKTNNIEKLITYINKRNVNNNLYMHFKLVSNDLDILHYFHNSINKLNTKLDIKNTNNNVINNIERIINKLLKLQINNEESKEKDIYENAKSIKNILMSIQNETKKLKILNIKKLDKISFTSNISSEFINNIIKSLDNIISTNKLINQNITIFIELINKLTDNLTHLYLLI